MQGKAVKTLKYVISFLAAAVLVFFALRGVDWENFASGLLSTRWAMVGVSVVAAVLALVFRMERWRLMLLPLDSNVRRIDIWDAENTGNLANTALPGSGEFIRCAFVSGGKGTYDKTLGTILLERIFDTLSIVALLAIALACKWSIFGTFFLESIVAPASEKADISFVAVLAGAVVLVAGIVLLIFRFERRSALCGKAASWLRGIIKGIKSFREVRRKGLFILYTILIWTMYIMMSYACILAVPALSGLTFSDALLLSAIGNFASVIPVPGGIGAYHYIIALCLSSLYQASWETGILFATLCHESHAILVILLGVVSALRFSIAKRKKNPDL